MTNIDKKKVELLLKWGKELKKYERNIEKMKDVRLREWLNMDTCVSQILNHLIEAENILGAIDDFQMENDQCFPDIEELYNELAYIRAKFTKYVDENLDLLTIDEQMKK